MKGGKGEKEKARQDAIEERRDELINDIVKDVREQMDE